MKAPVSWIREYVDLPADVTTEQLAARLTALGLKLEALDRPGDAITGPLVVGRVLTMEPEPQKNGKTINWCTVDVGDANGTGEPQGIVCGAHNFAPGDLVVVVLPGGVLPGRLRDLRAQDLRPRLGRDDLLGRELGHRRGPRRASSCCPPTRASPATTRAPVLGLDEEVIEFEINPDRAYALSLRGVAREAALAFDAPYTDPAAARGPRAERRRLPGRHRRPRRLPGVRGPHGHRLRPGGADAGLDGPAAHAVRACARSRWPSTSPTT